MRRTPTILEVQERAQGPLSSCQVGTWVDLDHMRTSMTSARSKVKVKVMELLKFRKSHYSRSISSTILAWISKLMIDHDSTVPGLQLVWARFSNFLLEKLSREFKFRAMSTFHEIRMAIFLYLSLIHIWRCRRSYACRSRWSPYH